MKKGKKKALNWSPASIAAESASLSFEISAAASFCVFYAICSPFLYFLLVKTLKKAQNGRKIKKINIKAQTANPSDAFWAAVADCSWALRAEISVRAASRLLLIFLLVDLGGFYK
jgi:hypothetical protein